MNKFYKQVIFIIIGVAIIAAGGFVIYAVSNRGAAAVGWWRFDEGVGASAYDASGNANTATITGATWKNEDECKFGKCLYFDGTGDSLSVTSASELNPTTGVTIEGWVKANSFPTSTNATIASKASQYSLDINQGMPRFRAYANSAWYSVQTPEGTDVGGQTSYTPAIFRETADGVLSEASASFTPAFGFRALTPTNLTAKKGVLTFDQLIKLQKLWRKKIDGLDRKKHLGQKLLEILFDCPIIKVNQAAKDLAVTFPTANSLLKDFVKAGILKEAPGFARNRLFSFAEYISLFKNE